MSRYVSFGVLIAVILILGIIFYRVMAAFILPLFLATVLVVVFGPLHKWVLNKTNQRRTLASSITTAIIGLAVILPIGGVGVIAFGEARHLFKYLTSGGIEQNLKRIRKSLDLEMPAPAEFRELEKTVRALDVRNVDELKTAEKQLDRIDEAADRLELVLKLPKANSTDMEFLEPSLIGTTAIEFWDTFRDSVRNARENQMRLLKQDMLETSTGSSTRQPQKSTDAETEQGTQSKEPSSEKSTAELQLEKKKNAG